MTPLLMTQPDMIDEMVRAASSPAFWVIVIGVCIIHAVVKATVDYFRKKR
jgi:hypothetical protein